MSKARITYRFESPAVKGIQSHKEVSVDVDRKVIPLHHEEYSVVEERSPLSAVTDHPSNYSSSVAAGRVRQSYGHHEPDEGELVQFTRHYDEWSSPIDEETRRIEQLIREADKHPSSATRQTGSRGPSVPMDRDEYDEAPPYDFDHLDVPQSAEAGVHEDRMANIPRFPRPPQGTPGAYDPNGLRAQGSHGANGLHSSDSLYGANDPYHPHSPDIELDDWVNRDNLYSSTMRLGRSSKPPWIKMIVSAGGAIIAGVLLGLFVLNLFSDGLGGNTAQPGSQLTPESAEAGGEATGLQGDVVDEGSATAGSAGAAGAGSEPAAALAHMVDVQLPKREYAMLQVGVFSSRESADAIMGELSRQGLAAAEERTGANIAVYAGVAMNRDHAQLLGAKLESAVPEMYAKNMALPAVGTVGWIGSKPEVLPNYLGSGDKLTQQLIQLSLVHLNEARPSALEDSEWQLAKQEHLNWTGYASTVSADVPETIGPLLQRMNTALNTAIVSLDQYMKNPESSYLWKIQEAVLQYIVAEKQLISEVTG